MAAPQPDPILAAIQAEVMRLNGQRPRIAHTHTAPHLTIAFDLVPQRWTLFGGLDLTERNARDRTAAYLQKGVRLGVAKDFEVGVSAVLFASYRKRQYDAYSAIFDARRNEDEQG